VKSRQLSLLPSQPLQHGGDCRAGKRKTARPIDPKRPMHVTIRSSRARGAWSMLHPRHARRVDALAHRTARRHGVRLYRFVNVGNHAHLLVRARKRAHFQAFLRDLTGSIAITITGARKGNPVGKFWDRLAWSRVVSWGREFRDVLRDYFLSNSLEASELGRRFPRRPRAGPP
jgi:hypothetical protein